MNEQERIFLGKSFPIFRYTSSATANEIQKLRDVNAIMDCTSEVEINQLEYFDFRRSKNHYSVICVIRVVSAAPPSPDIIARWINGHLAM